MIDVPRPIEGRGARPRARSVGAALALALSLCGAVATGVPAAANQFAYIGHYWYAGQTKWYGAAEPCGRHSPPLSWQWCDISYYPDPTNPSGWYTPIQFAASGWTVQPPVGASDNVDLWDVTGTPAANESNDITLSSQNLGTNCQGPAGKYPVGEEASGYVVQDQNILEYIIINDEPCVNWYTGVGTIQSNQVDLESVASHEFGHALGLHHNTPGPNAGVVMECVIAPGEKENPPDTGDLDGIRWLYAQNGQSTYGPELVNPPC